MRFGLLPKHRHLGEGETVTGKFFDKKTRVMAFAPPRL